MIATALALLFAIFPAPFAIFLLACFAIAVVVAVLKIIALVLDSIPFL